MPLSRVSRASVGLLVGVVWGCASVGLSAVFAGGASSTLLVACSCAARGWSLSARPSSRVRAGCGLRELGESERGTKTKFRKNSSAFREKKQAFCTIRAKCLLFFPYVARLVRSTLRPFLFIRGALFFRLFSFIRGALFTRGRRLPRTHPPAPRRTLTHSVGRSSRSSK